nr:MULTISPECIES: Rieske 2Fe-2S domain-containing protein [unclassified Pseudomonas]
MADIQLCALDQVPNGGALGLEATLQGQPAALIAVRWGEQVRVYRNRCPHFSIPLDYQPGLFCTYRNQLLMCAHHGAMFRFDNGDCIDGPCEGARLDSVRAYQQDGSLWLAEIQGANEKVHA